MRRSRFFLLAGVAALLLGVVALWQWRVHERDGSAALARGLAALDRGDARSARVELMNAIRGNPRDAQAHAAQARVLVELNDGAGAQAEVERARALGWPTGEGRVVMAQALLLQGDAPAALREARAPDRPADAAAPVARIVARALLMEGDPAGAQVALEQALKVAPADAQNWMELGRFNMAVGDEAGAIRAADRAVALAPADAKILALRGEMTRAQYGLIAALPWFERAMAIKPDAVPVLEQYAATLADAGQASRALGITRHILALDPSNPRAWLIQAVMAARAGKDDLARTLLDRTQGRLDDEPATRLLRGVLHLDDGNALLAVQALSPLVDAQPDNDSARALLGRAYYMNGDPASAATILAPLVARRDADPYVLTLAARAQEGMGNAAMAADMLGRAAWPVRAAADGFVSARDGALAAGPPPANAATAGDNIPYIRALLNSGRVDAALERSDLLARGNTGAPAAWLVRGDALTVAGRPGDAALAYQAAANIRFDRDVALRLAAALGRAGNRARAAQVVRLFLTQNPDDVEARRLAAGIAAQDRDWRTALRLLRGVQAQMGNNDAVLMADLARAALESGDGAAAERYAVHAYRLMPGNPMTADMLGWVLLRVGRKGPGAVDLLEKAVRLAPGAPALLMHLGQAYAAAGRPQEARIALNRAASFPAFPERRDALAALAAL